MGRFLPIVLSTAILLCPGIVRADLKSGLALYNDNRLEDALPHFQTAAADSPDPDTHAWLAETLRRLDRYEEAERSARRALELSDCHSFAHCVLGDLANPQYRTGAGASAATAMDHYEHALRCNPDDANPWIRIWAEALRMEDPDRERRALDELARTRFFTPSTLAYDRWMLQDVPEQAVLLTNGDLDTYPALVLQQSERLRPDVAIVSYSMLNLEWYARRMASRHGLHLPERFPEPYIDPVFGLIPVARQLVSTWIDLQSQGALGRPLAVSVTVTDIDVIPGARARLQLAGSYFHCRPGPAEPVDTERVQASLRGVEADDFAGPFVSPTDRSSVRRAYGTRLAGNVVTTALRSVVAALDQNEVPRARELFRWSESFCDQLPTTAAGFQEPLRQIRSRLQELETGS